MRLRVPLLMKKRGQRRTGARWQGPLGEAILYAAFVLVGVLGLATLVVGVFAPSWPWLVAIIPFSLVVVGTMGLVELLWQSSTSSELRAAVAQKAADIEQRLTTEGTPIPLPGVPSIDQVIDSPGVRLAHRLPIDTSPNWLLLAMSVICICWTTLVAVFVYQVVGFHLKGEPNWLLTWLMVPCAMIALWTLVALGREIWMTTGLGTTRLEVSHHPLHPGETCEVFVSQAGRTNIRWLHVSLTCQERATYAHGTDTRTETRQVHRQLLQSKRKFDISSEKPFEAELQFTVPSGAMHSFASAHNAVEWSLVVRGKVARWPIFERRFPIYVYPALISNQPEKGPTNTSNEGALI